MTRSTGSGSAVRSALALVAVLACAEALEFRALSPALGLEVVGLERRAIGSKETSSELRAAFAASRGLLLVRGLDGLTKDELVALASTFGRVEASPADGAYEALVEGDARVHEFSTVPSSKVFGGERPADWRYDAEAGRPSWHTDQSFRDPRPVASCMYCKATPGGRVGATVFASTVAALEDVDAVPALRARLEGLTGCHSYAHLAASFARLSEGGEDALSAERKAALAAPARHALVDGDALYLAPHVIEDVVDEGGSSAPDARAVVDALSSHATRRAYVHEHAWEAGDFVVWNNWRTMHAATEVPAARARERVMRRTTMVEDDDDDDGGAAAAAAAAVVLVDVLASEASDLAARALESAGSAAAQAAAAAAALVASEVDGKAAHGLRRVADRAGEGCEIPNFGGSYLGRFPLVSADVSTSDHLSERCRT